MQTVHWQLTWWPSDDVVLELTSTAVLMTCHRLFRSASETADQPISCMIFQVHMYVISYTISYTYDFISEMCAMMSYKISYYKISNTFHMNCINKSCMISYTFDIVYDFIYIWCHMSWIWFCMWFHTMISYAHFIWKLSINHIWFYTSLISDVYEIFCDFICRFKFLAPARPGPVQKRLAAGPRPGRPGPGDLDHIFSQ